VFIERDLEIRKEERRASSGRQSESTFNISREGIEDLGEPDTVLLGPLNSGKKLLEGAREREEEKDLRESSKRKEKRRDSGTAVPDDSTSGHDSELPAETRGELRM